MYKDNPPQITPNQKRPFTASKQILDAAVLNKLASDFPQFQAVALHV
jgi:hypothetical protein